MWDSFQTSAIIIENLPFLCLWNPNCICKSVPVYACFRPCMQAAAHIRGPKATLVILFPIFVHLKGYIFHFNTLQVNLISDWALNWPWALEFGHHWGTRAQVVRGTKCSVYIYLRQTKVTHSMYTIFIMSTTKCMFMWMRDLPHLRYYTTASMHRHMNVCSWQSKENKKGNPNLTC